MRTQVQLKNSRSDAEVRELLGRKPRAEDASVTLTGDVSVFKPTGERLVTVLRGAIDKRLIDAAYPFMWEMRKHETTNRGNYAGIEREATPEGSIRVGRGQRTMGIKRDGSVSKTAQAAPVRSVTVGAFDRNPRIPYCRQTAHSTRHPEMWGEALPFIRRVGELFKETVPDRHAAQLEEAIKTHPAYVLPGTPFTTITVNNTVAGAYHTDKGDYAPGFGVMAVFRKGTYSGAQLVFPKYGVGADLQHGDVIFFDPHEVHGNTPFHTTIGKEAVDWVRISMVFYFRSKMTQCLAPNEEIERAKQQSGGKLTHEETSDEAEEEG